METNVTEINTVFLIKLLTLLVAQRNRHCKSRLTVEV